MRDCESEMKMEQHSLDGSVFALVFLQAKHAGAAVLTCLVFHGLNMFGRAMLLMLFWTPDMLFNIDLGPMNPDAENFQFLEEKRDSTVKGLN